MSQTDAMMAKRGAYVNDKGDLVSTVADDGFKAMYRMDKTLRDLVTSQLSMKVHLY